MLLTSSGKHEITCFCLFKSALTTAMSSCSIGNLHEYEIKKNQLHKKMAGKNRI